MSECTCHKNYTLDTLIPKVGVITDIRQETPDVKTFRVEAPEGGKLFEHMPGQCAMVCAPGVSEGMFSITSSPTVKDYQEFSIKKCGSLTDHLHSLQVGDEIAVRGPYGEGVNVYLTIDREQEGWDGHVGFVPNYLKEIGFDTNKTALVCGPPIMIKFVLAGLEELGFSRDQVYTTLELRMKCGVGKCGRCNIGDKYVCKDGPVFRCDEVDELPNEY